MIVPVNPNSVRGWRMIPPTIQRATPLSPRKTSLPRRGNNTLYESALAARLKRIAGPRGALAAAIAGGLANNRRARIGAVLDLKSITKK